MASPTYDPAKTTWDILPATTLAAREGSAAVWIPTIKKLFIWGGGDGVTFFADGALYDPVTRTWSTLPAAPLTARYLVRAFWTGKEVLLWGGMASATGANDGALYDPATNTWRTIPAAPVKGRWSFVAGFEGDSFAFFGGSDGSMLSDGAVLTLSTLSWSPLPAVPTGYTARTNPQGWLFRGVLCAWGGGIGMGTTTAYRNDGIETRIGSTSWSSIPSVGAPSGRMAGQVVTTEKFVWLWSGWTDLDWPTSGALFVP